MLSLERFFRWAWLIAFAVCIGCGVAGVPQPPSLELPQAVSDLRAVRKGNDVFLFWTLPNVTTDNLPVRHLGETKVCRNTGVATTDCASVVGRVPAPPNGRAKEPNAKANFMDALTPDVLSNNPGKRIGYAVTVTNDRGKGGPMSNTAIVPGLMAPPAPLNFHAQVTAEGITLGWASDPTLAQMASVHHVYRVYRREEGKETDTVAGEATVNSPAVVDHTFEWGKTYLYRVTVATLIGEGRRVTEFESDDSPMVKVFARDVFPPAVPSGLQAVFSGTGQQPFIDLIWAPDIDADLAGYNVFRSEEGTQAGKINSELLKSPAFRDSNVMAGHTYIYSVSAVDVRGNESARSEQAKESVP
jgi:hypothetical protein